MPAWGNYKPLFEHVGYEVVPYNYYDSKNHGVDFDSVMDVAKTALKGALLVLQGCCHNPTGADLTKDQWKELAAVMKKRGLIPFFGRVPSLIYFSKKLTLCLFRCCVSRTGKRNG